MDYMGLAAICFVVLAAICFVVLAVIGAVWIHFRLTQRHSRQARTISPVRKATMPADISQPVASADMSSMSGTLKANRG
jgi:hypothetical protein